MIIDGVVIELVEDVDLEEVSRWILDMIRVMYNYNHIIDYNEYRHYIDPTIERGIKWLKKRKNMYRIISNIFDRLNREYSLEEFEMSLRVYLSGCFYRTRMGVEGTIVQYMRLSDY